MELIIIRHGEAKHNLGKESEHVFAGNTIDNKLTTKGIKNAFNVADKLKNDDIGIVYFSPLKRSRQTADIIIRKLRKKISSQEIKDLSELNVGDLTGHTEKEVRNMFPVEANTFYNADITHWNFPSGENFQEISQRVDRLLEKIKASRTNKKILICGHGMINRVIFYKIAFHNTKLWQERSYPHDKIVRLKI